MPLQSQFLSGSKRLFGRDCTVTVQLKRRISEDSVMRVPGYTCDTEEELKGYCSALFLCDNCTFWLSQPVVRKDFFPHTFEASFGFCFFVCIFFPSFFGLPSSNVLMINHIQRENVRQTASVLAIPHGTGGLAGVSWPHDQRVKFSTGGHKEIPFLWSNYPAIFFERR